MNTLVLIAFALVALCYCGGKYCPSLLKQNKEMALGVLVGMALCSFTDLRIEGFDSLNYMTCMQGAQRIMNDCRTQWEEANPSESPYSQILEDTRSMFPPELEPLVRINLMPPESGDNQERGDQAAQAAQMFGVNTPPVTTLPSLPELTQSGGGN